MSLTKLSIVLSLSMLSLASAASPLPRAAAPVQGCNGCAGSGGSSSASGGTCSGFVSVNVTVAGGKCQWVKTFDPVFISCSSVRQCRPTVERSWSGLEPGSTLGFCVTSGEELWCLEPAPEVGGGGSGSDSRPSAPFGCASTLSFSISSASCGLSAAVAASCSGCGGS